MIRSRRTLLVAMALLLAAAYPAPAQEWTRFRGENGAGIGQATGLPVQWTEKDHRWNIQLPGTGHSSPILWGNRIFLTCTDAKTAQRIVVCINAEDGQSLWKREYPSRTYRQNPDNSYASSSVAADDKRIYACWTAEDQYTLLALTHDGQDAWRINLGPYKAQHGSGTSPIVFEDLVILGNDQEGPASFIIAVDSATGHERWKLPRKGGSAVYGTPCIYRPAGRPPQLIFTGRSTGMTSIDPRSGKVNWEVPDLLDRRVVASPVVAGDLLIAQCGEGSDGRCTVAVRPPADEKDKPRLAWRLAREVPYVPTPLFKDGLLYLWSDKGVVTCVRADDGKTVWQERLNAPFYTSPIWVDGRIYNISKKGEVFVLAAGEKFQLLGKSNLGELCYTTPAIAHGRMYIRTHTKLMCLGK